ncbi:MAG: repressor LexA [Deltaproteobacteria bacterium]|nr:MAG: repressor LexA [Deltaproteobacteria bacterium]
MSDLSSRQQQLLDILRAAFDQTGVCPSYREIASAMGINSTNGVSDHIKALERKGYVERVGGRGASRSIRLTDRAVSSLSGDGVVGVPLVGRVAAGSLHAAVEDTQGTLRFDQRLLPRGGDVFALKVHGDSMIEDGIFDGDTVLVQRCEHVHRGEIAVVLVEEETTLKRVFREGNKLRLQPSNSQMEPILVSAESGEVRIIGRAVGVWRAL